MKKPNDPDKVPQNKQNRDGRYTPTTFRFAPEDLEKLDALCAECEQRTGLPTDRAKLVRALIRLEHKKRCPRRT